MIIFLYGSDDYRRVQKKKEIVGEFQKKYSDLGIGSFDLAADGEFDKLTEFLRNQSIFESKKLAIVENLFPARKSVEEVEASSVKRQASSTEEGKSVRGKKKTKDAEGPIALVQKYLEAKNITILISEQKKPVKAYGFLLEKPVLAQEFEVLAGSAWDAFIKKEAKERGVTLAPASAKFLAAVFQGNSWALATELQRLAAFSGAVEMSDLGGLDIAPDYWALMNGVKSFDMRARLSALEKMLGTSDPAPKLFNILASQWREKTAQMAEYDRMIKSGKLEYEEALVDLVL